MVKTLYWNCCAVLERTRDDAELGRCHMPLKDGKTCPRHGDVTEAMVRYRTTGELTDERELKTKWHLAWRNWFPITE